KLDKNSYNIGTGFLFSSQDAEFAYSFGIRYLRSLLEGHYTNTYAWNGAAIHGVTSDTKFEQIVSYGAGVGVEFHFRWPIHLYVDTGYRYSKSEKENVISYEIRPTVNSALKYQW
ncbi:MAG: hypothetical protein HRT71_15340, partial [Flavobacteriales bacterium]|nr:hypothetical protein [Flavobacteriales bacterium]